MTSPLDRQADCPQCGAPMTFKFAGARAQVCRFCKFVVARTDRGLVPQGRMADLLEIATPLQLGVTGKWAGEPFEVIGRVQMDRAGAPGAPWQEILVVLPRQERYTWVAYAQGRWYATSEVAAPADALPPLQTLRPGGHVELGPHGHWVVQEVGQRRVVSGEGDLSNVPAPGAITGYADLSAQGGRFGTIDYGTGQAAPTLFLGSQFDPQQIQTDAGVPLEAPRAAVSEVTCPTCGGKLPLLSQAAERVVCRFCGTASDVNQGVLAALGPSPRPPIQPFIAIGAEGVVRGLHLVVVGFVVRSCVVEGEVYSWREYLLFARDSQSYRWLMEEDGNWQWIEPIETGDVHDSGHGVGFRGASYSFKQQVQAKIDYVIGEFYWKVAIGETVEATEFQGPGGKVSRERSAAEITYSFCSPLDPRELGVFGVAPPIRPMMMGSGGAGGSSVSSAMMTIVIVIVICLVLSLVIGGAGASGSSGSGTYYGGPSFGGK